MSYYGIQQLFINGEFVHALSTDLLTKMSPFDGSVLAQIQCASRSDVRVAVRSAEKAGGYWRAVGIRERARVLRLAARLIVQNATGLAILESQDTGRDVAQVLERDVLPGASALERSADIADLPDRSGAPLEAPRPQLSFFIGDSQSPFKSAVMAVSAVLVSGGTILLKPYETSCLSTLRLASLFQEAELPAGVLNVLTGPDALMTGWFAEYESTHRVLRRSEGL
jgi:betaine-aldehyde dehydrogenase